MIVVTREGTTIFVNAGGDWQTPAPHSIVESVKKSAQALVFSVPVAKIRELIQCYLTRGTAFLLIHYSGKDKDYMFLSKDQFMQIADEITTLIDLSVSLESV